MKRMILLLLILAVLPAHAGQFLGVKKASEFIVVALQSPLDSLYGIQRKPDSVHLFTYADNGTSAAFQTRSVTYPFSDISIDTVKHFTDTMYYLVDQIQDIDGAGGNFLLSIDIQMYYDKTPTHTFATVQVINDSLNIATEAARIARDTLQNQDNWVAKEASTDTVNIKTMLTNNPSVAGGDALKPATIGRVLDVDVLNRAFVDVKAISADDVAADSLEAWLDGYTNTQLTSREQLFTNLDQKISTRSKIGDTANGLTAADVWNLAFGTSFTAGSMGDSLNNSTYVQGSASSLTVSGIVNGVWDELQSAHTTAGTFGKYLDTEVSGVSSGTGSFGYTIVTYDSANLQPVGGVSLTLRNINQTALVAVGSSDINGSESFNLNADSFVVVATAPGYLFTPFDSLVVVGSGVDSVFGYPFNPGTPSPGLCRVFGFLLNVSGVGEANAEVSAHLPKGVSRAGSSIVSPFGVRTTTDSWAIDVVPSSLLNPATSIYEFLITRSDGTILRKRVTVPNQTSWQLSW